GRRVSLPYRSAMARSRGKNDLTIRCFCQRAETFRPRGRAGENLLPFSQIAARCDPDLWVDSLIKDGRLTAAGNTQTKKAVAVRVIRKALHFAAWIRNKPDLAVTFFVRRVSINKQAASVTKPNQVDYAVRHRTSDLLHRFVVNVETKDRDPVLVCF